MSLMLLSNITVLGQVASRLSPGWDCVHQVYSCAWVTNTVHSAPREEEGVNMTILGKENKNKYKKQNNNKKNF